MYQLRSYAVTQLRSYAVTQLTVKIRTTGNRQKAKVNLQCSNAKVILTLIFTCALVFTFTLKVKLKLK